RDNGSEDSYARRQAAYFTDLAERAAAGMQGGDERAWGERCVPDYNSRRAAFEHVMAAGDTDRALRLSTSLAELVHLRIGYEPAGWEERAVARAPADPPLIPTADP